MRTAAFVTTPVERLCVPAPTDTVALAADTVSTRWPATFTIAAVYLCSQCPCCLRSLLICFVLFVCLVLLTLLNLHVLSVQRIEVVSAVALYVWPIVFNLFVS